jgi:hypothetical protein
MISFNVNMRRFVSIGAKKDKTIGTNLKGCRHLKNFAGIFSVYHLKRPIIHLTKRDRPITHKNAIAHSLTKNTIAQSPTKNTIAQSLTQKHNAIA